MGQSTKTILTVFIAIACFFIFIAAAAIFGNSIWDVRYRVKNNSAVEIKEVSLKEIGTNYSGQTDDKYIFYEVRAVVANPYNVDKEDNKLYFYYENNMPDAYYEVKEIEDNTFFSSDNLQLIPAGKEAVITRVIAVEQGCKQIKVCYRNFYTQSERSFDIAL